MVVLNEVKSMAKTNKNTMTKRHQTGGSQQDEGALQEGGRVLNFERRLHCWTMDMLMLAHNYYNWLFCSWLDGDGDCNGLVVVHGENVTYF